MSCRLARTAAAVAVANSLFVTAIAHAAAQDEAEVVVTATRFASADPRVPANITVISQDDIRRAPASSLPDILKAYAGIDAVSLYGGMGVDATVDVRGFGGTAVSNTLVLLDGERINPIDAGSVSWSAIPLASIQRIEIIRGAGTVLYGDRASGGVINIITDKSARAGNSVTVGAGSHGQESFDAALRAGKGDGYVNLFVHHAADDGWRDNAHQRQEAATGRAGYYLASGEIFVNYSVYQDANGLPGALPTAVFLADPKHSFTPADYQKRNGYRLRPGLKLSIAPGLELEAELGGEHEHQSWNMVSFGSTSDRNKSVDSFTPRLRWQHGLGGLSSETVFGMDYYAGGVRSHSSAMPDQSADQTSSAFYFQNSTDLSEAWTLTLGGRNQRMDQRVRQAAAGGFFPTPAMDGSAVRSEDAYDLGLSVRGRNWRAYGKVGSTFRFANTDELFGYDPITGQTIFAGDLRPQHGTIQEIGGSAVFGSLQGRVSLYRMDLTDEIGLDANFANVNLDPTRRQGLELEGEWQPADRVRMRLAYSYTQAEFRSGQYAGRQIPLVAKDRLTAQFTWDAGAAGIYSAALNCVGARPYSGDFVNATGNLAGYATLDLSASTKIADWTLTARLNNALDKRYAPWGTYATYTPMWYPGPAGADHWYYPADGRSFYVSARYDLK